MKAVSDKKMQKIIQRLLKLHIFGKWPNITANTLFAVGNGTSDTDRRNALEVRDNSIVVNGQELTKEEIANILNHLTNKSNPHGVTPDQIGAAKKSDLNNIAAVSLVDKTYADKTVKVNYGAEGITDVAKVQNLVVWQWCGDSEIELRCLPPYTLHQVLQDYFYTESEVDAKFASVGDGGSAGMVREFEASPNSREFLTPGNASKFYIVTIGSSGNYRASCAVDYREILSCNSVVYPILYQPAETLDIGAYKLRAEIVNDGTKKVKFTLAPPTIGDWANDSTVQITKICGYY